MYLKIGAVDFLTAQDEQVQPNRKKVSLNAKKVYHSSSEEELDLSSKHEQPLELKPVRKDNVKADKPIKSKETTSYKKATDTSEIKNIVRILLEDVLSFEVLFAFYIVYFTIKS